MLQSVFKGWNIFKKKEFFFYPLIVSLVYLVYSFFIESYLGNKLVDLTEAMVDVKAIHIFNYSINYFGWELLLILFLWFVGLFIISYLIYIISLSESKYTEEFWYGFSKVLGYAFLMFIVLIAISFLSALFLSYLNVITIILLVILALCLIAISFVFTFGNIYLGLNNLPVSEALAKGWKFTKRRFWLIIAFFIVLVIKLYLIYWIIDQLYYFIFYYNETVSIILRAVILIVYLLISINAIAIFTKKFTRK